MSQKSNNRLNFFIWLCISGIVILPFALTIAFSTPFSDDFATANELTGMSGNIFIDSIVNTTNKYFTWAGGWPFNLPQNLLNPLVLFPNKSYMYGIELCVFFLIFIIVFYYFVKVVSKYIFQLESVVKIRYYYVLLLFAFLNTAVYNDVFYWFVGNSYLWEVTFCLLNQIFIILFFRKSSSTKYFVLLIVFGFIACFAYQLAVLSGMLYLYELYNSYKNNSKIEFIMIVPLLIMVFSGLISCFAPGNFARQEAEAASASIDLNKRSIFSSLTRASFIAFQHTITCSIKLLSQPFVVLSLVFTIYLGIKHKDDNNYVHPFIMGGLNVIAIFLICLPIALGYSSYNLPNRTIFLINFAIFISFNFLMFNIGNRISKIFIIKKNIKDNSVTIICAIVLFLSIALCSTTQTGTAYFFELPWVNTSLNISQCYNESCETWKTINFIKNSQDNIVVVDSNKYSVENGINGQQSNVGPTTNIVRKFVLTDNPEHIVNIVVAQYYHKDQIYAIF